MKYSEVIRLEIKHRDRITFRGLLRCEAIVWIWSNSDLIKKIQKLKNGEKHG